MKILKSLVVIVAVAALAAGATTAIFSSQTKLDDNTFATGTLEIRIDSLTAAPGFNFTNAVPGDMTTKNFTLMNYGLPWFAGPSTLPAKELAVSAPQDGGDTALYDALIVTLYDNAGWGGCNTPGDWVAGKGCRVYTGSLSGLDGSGSTDILHHTNWGAHPSLAAGSSLSMKMEVELPISADSSLMGMSTTFDLVIDGYNPHR